MAVLENALALARQNVRLFPITPNTKIPALSDFTGKSISDPERLRLWFSDPTLNSGIACGKVADNRYLVGIDIDDKEGKRGYETLSLIEITEGPFPKTWAQKTPSGGEHRLFWSPVPIRQGTNVLGEGIDTRGDGGYLVGPGSVLDGRTYDVICDAEIAQLPPWVIEGYEKSTRTPTVKGSKAAPAGNQVLAIKQSVEYLQLQEPSHTGGRSNDCFRHAARMKDFGLAQEEAVNLLANFWNCEPPLSMPELEFTIGNAYHYSKNAAGVAAPENLFEEVKDEDPVAPPPEVAPLTTEEKCPLELMNEDHFYYAANGVTRVCKEGRRNGKFHLERYAVAAFHEKYGARKMMHNGKEAPVTRVWMESAKRREYEYLRFDPSHTIDSSAYNTWRGFAVKPWAAATPVDPRAEKALGAFQEHCLNNVCGGDRSLYEWLVSFMAHIFQNPGDKPRVSLVFQGKKGTGKTVISEILDHLIGDNSVIIANRSHVLGHFNSIMEDKLLVTLDEAFWSGDKQVEGTLKDIITGRTRVITHKGAEPYAAAVFDRIIIISNEDWVVPASSDERRFAVFKVGDGRRQDNKFFGEMKDGLFNHGGAELLMHWFLHWEIAANVDTAPETEGLREQKDLSLSIFHQWWLNCLQDGRILGSSVEGWPDVFSVNDFYSSFNIHLQEENFRGFKPSKIHVGRMFTQVASWAHSKVSTGNVRVYDFAPLDLARMEWDEFRGFAAKWE